MSVCSSIEDLGKFDGLQMPCCDIGGLALSYPALVPPIMSKQSQGFGEQEGLVKRPGLMRNMQQYTHGSTTLRSRSCDVESVVVHLQLDEAENAGAESAVAESEFTSASSDHRIN